MAKKNKGKRNWLYTVMFVIALCIFVYSAFHLFSIFKSNWDEKKELEKVSEIANIPENIEEPFVVNWEGLKEVNANTAGWILIPGTNISYPITFSGDNKYYLEHTFEGEANYAGAIFIDEHNNTEFLDFNTFIYGHNTRHGTMFGELEKFADATFFDEHPYVYLFTPNQTYRCEIVAFHSLKDQSSLYQVVPASLSNTYVDMMKDPSIPGFVREEVSVGEEDRLISLSTCSYEINNELTDQRYLLQAKLVAWDKEYYE